jgi:hypothetical protein
MTRKKGPVWSVRAPVDIKAMVLAGNTLISAGLPDVLPKTDVLAAIEGRMGGVLLVSSRDDGSKLAELKLDSPPVFDGLIAAGDAVYLVTRDGSVRCYK